MSGHGFHVYGNARRNCVAPSGVRQRVVLVRNANERNTDLLRNLGLNNLFEVESKVPGMTDGLVEAAPLDADPAIGRTDQAECMIEAHEALVDADPENLARFKDVLEYLKQDLRAGSK